MTEYVTMNSRFYNFSMNFNKVNSSSISMNYKIKYSNNKLRDGKITSNKFLII